MKKLVMGLALILSLGLVGCSSDPVVKDVAMDDIKSAVNTEVLLPHQPVAEMPASEFYVFENVKDKFSEGFALNAMMSTTLQNVFVVKANTPDDVEAIKVALDEYKSNDSFRSYADGYGGEHNIDAAANSILGSTGNYVYFIAAEDSAAVESAILSLFE